MNDYLFEEGDLGEYLGGHPDGGPTPSRAAPIVSPRAMRTAMRTATPASAASALAEAPREVAERPAPNRRLVVMLSLDDTELVLPRAPDDAATDGLAMLGCFHLRYVSRGRHAQLDLDVIQMSAGVTGPYAEGVTAVLAPADLSFKLSSASAAEPSAHAAGGSLGGKFEAALLASHPIDCCISYSDLKMIAEIGASLGPNSPKKSPSGRGGPPTTPSADSPPPSLATWKKEASAASAASAARPSRARSRSGGPAPTAQVSVAVQLDRVRLVAINDLNGRATPLAALTAAEVTASASGTLAQLALMTDATLTFDVFNPAYSAWEPLLEPCTARLDSQARHCNNHTNSTDGHSKSAPQVHEAAQLLGMAPPPPTTTATSPTASASASAIHSAMPPISECAPASAPSSANSGVNSPTPYIDAHVVVPSTWSVNFSYAACELLSSTVPPQCIMLYPDLCGIPKHPRTRTGSVARGPCTSRW